MKLSAFIDGVGLLGPGFNNWSHGADVLSEISAYSPSLTALPTPVLLPATERRRSGRVVKLALAVALEATERAQRNPGDLASVFASSGGDGHNCHELCQALALSTREVSPTRFSNSVHNAAAGYWSIATGATLESSVLCAHDASFGAGLLEALTQVVVDRMAVLFVSYDTDYPPPLRAKRPVPDAFGLALVLSPERCRTSVARIEASFTDEVAETLADPQLESMRQSIPAARGLPLLRQLARRHVGRTVVDYLDDLHLLLEVEPCA